MRMELIGIFQRGSWYEVGYLNTHGQAEKAKVQGWKKLNRFLKYNNIFHKTGQPFYIPANNHIVKEIVDEQTD